MTKSFLIRGGLAASAMVALFRGEAFAETNCKLWEHVFSGNAISLPGGREWSDFSKDKSFKERKWRGSILGWETKHYSPNDLVSSLELFPTPSCPVVRLIVWEHAQFTGRSEEVTQILENGNRRVPMENLSAVGLNDSISSASCECLGRLSPTEGEDLRPPLPPPPAPPGF